MKLTTRDEPEDEATALELIQGEAYEWIAHFIGGQTGAADLKAMRAWYEQSPAHAAAYAEARRVWRALGPVAREAMRRRSAVAATDRAKSPSGRPERSPYVGRRALLGGALAASATYLMIRPPMGLWPSYPELLADYRTATGEQRQVTVSENVSLDLNTQTSVAIRLQTGGGVQLELIAGEAAISTRLTPARVTVAAAGGRVVADRAHFNLRCQGAEVSISCLEGELRVEWQSVSKILAAQQQVTYGKRGMGPVATINPDRVTAWQQGLLIFESTPVIDVIDEINRYRRGHIVLMNEDIGRRRLSARLRIAEADKIVNQIIHIFGARATTLPGGIVVLS